MAAALSSDGDHHAPVELFSGMHLANRPMLVPAPIVAEIGYLLAREAGADVVAVAERLRIADIATLDRRHFAVVRPRHIAAFTLLP